MAESIGFRAGLGSLGGSTLGQVLVRVGLDTKQIDTGLTKAKGQAATAGTSFSKFGAYASAAFALAGIAAVKFGADSIKSAQEHEAVLAQLRVAIDGSTQAYEAQATALQNLTGFQDEEVLAADAILARFKLSEAQIQKTIPLVLDYARATGQDVPSAATAFGKALLGNTRALKSVGIDVELTGNKEKDLAIITQALTDRVGGASEAFGQTFAGKVEILKAKFDDLKEEIGGGIIIVLQQLIADMEGTLGIIQRLIDLIPGMGPAADDASEGVSGLQRSFFGLAFVLHAVQHPFDTVLHGFSIDIPDGTATAADGIDALSGTTDAFTTRLEENAQALRDEKTAMKALTSGTVGLLASLDQLKSAQRDLNKARHDSKTTASELRAAELSVLQAQLGVTGSFKDLVEKMTDAHSSAEDIVARFQEMASKAGLTRDEIRSLTSFIEGYIDKLNQIPSSVNTDVTVNRNLVTTGGASHPRPGSHPHPTPPPIRGSGVTVNIISPTDPAQAIVNNLGAWQRANRDWAG